MATGQIITIRDFLPSGVSPDDFYIFVAASAMFVVLWVVIDAFIERDRLTPRLKMIEARRKELKAEYTSPKKRKKIEQNIDLMKKIVDKLKILQETKTDDINRNLIQAGFRSNDAPIVYMFGKVTLPFVGLIAGVIFSDIDWNIAFDKSQMKGWLIVIISSYAGVKLPDFIVGRKRKKRYHAIRKALSDTLDLMMICAEAGLSLAATLDRVAKELGNTYLEMADELGLTSVEMGFLPDRNTALKNLAKRVDIEEIRGIVNVLGQTEKYGTPISQALRVLSKDFRTERMLRAEAKAAKLPALMTVPMIIFILPTLFIIIIAPAVIGVMDNMKGM